MPKTFPVYLRRRIPVLTKGVGLLILFCVIIIFLLIVFMLPATGSHDPLEMKTAYYILAVPDGIKYLSALAFLALVIFTPLYFLRRKIVSTLTFFEDRISIATKRETIMIPFKNIDRVLVNDRVNYSGQSMFRLHIAIRYDSDKRLAFLLADYSDSNELMNLFSVMDPGKFRFYDFRLPSIDDDV